MRTQCLTLYLLCLTSLAFTQERLSVNTAKSDIRWIGEYAFYFGGHDGKISLKEGYFIKTDDIISGGLFIIDMNTIKSLDMDDEEARLDLDKHL